MRLSPRVPGAETIQIGLVKSLKLQDLPRGDGRVANILHLKTGNPRVGRGRGFRRETRPQFESGKSRPGRYRAVQKSLRFVKRNTRTMHDSCDGDDARSAGEGAGFDRRSLDQTRRGDQSPVSTDHAPSADASAPVPRRVRADGTARIHAAGSCESAGHQQRECEEAPAAGAARYANQLSAKTLADFFELSEETPLHLGEGQGRYETPGLRCGLGAPSGNRGVAGTIRRRRSATR